MRTAPRLLVLLALLFAPAGARAAATYVYGMAGFPSGTAGVPAASGDFDEDGRPDVVLVDFEGQRASMLFGRGGGLADTGVRLATGVHPVAAVVGDFDHSGHADVAVLNAVCPMNTEPCPPGSITVFLGDGKGGFTAEKDFDTGAAPVSLAAADVDGNGVADLLVATHVSLIDSGAPGSVTVHLGKGDGTFGAGTGFPANLGVIGLGVADFNGDRKLDVLVVNHPNLSDHKLSLLTGAGDGTFGKPVEVSASGEPVALVVGDFNADMKADVALATNSPFPGNSAFSLLNVLLGRGDGTFNSTTYPVGFGPMNIRSADMNGDGRPDLLVGVATNALPPGIGALSVLLNRGGGVFGGHVDTTTGTREPFLTGDVNGDGRTDVLLGEADGSVQVLLGVGDGMLPQAMSSDSGGPLPAGLAAADFDGDAHLDVTVANFTCNGSPCANSTVAVLRGNGHGGFRSSALLQADDNAIAVATADFNHDGRPDVAALSNGKGRVDLFLGVGRGAFMAGAKLTTDDGAQDLVAADFNGDGVPDLAVSCANADVIDIFLGKGDGTFATAVTYATAAGPRGLVAADVDGDKMIDLAVAASHTPTSFRDTGKISVLLGKGDGTFATRVDADVASLSPVDVAAADFTGDGVLDLAVASNLRDLGRLVTLQGKGDGTFTMLPDAPLTGNEALGVSAGDFDGDGRGDVALVNAASNTVQLYSGDGHGALALRSTFGGGAAPAALVSGDYDGDGRLDLVVANQGSNSISAWLSTCGGAPCPLPPEPPDAGVGGDDVLTVPPTDDAGSPEVADAGMPPVGSDVRCGCSTGSGSTPTLCALLLLALSARRRRS